MKHIFLLLSFLYEINLQAQPGFNRSYDLGAKAAGFFSIEHTHDTIVVYGVAKEFGMPAFGMLFARMDTFGNIIDHQVYNDSLEDDFTRVNQKSFIKLSNGGGYAGVGQIFYRDDGYLALFDMAGNVTRYMEYEDQVSLADFFRQVLELKDGFLILGEKQNPITYNAEIFALKTDFDGNVLWERKYPTPNRATYLGDCILLNMNEYVISGSTVKKNVPLNYTNNTSKIFAIDSLGNLKWEWQTQPSLDEMGAGSIFHTNDNKWVYHSARGWYNATYNEISKQPKMVVRDEQFNLIKQDTFGVADSPVTAFLNVIPLQNGGWMAMGTKPANYATQPFSTEFNALSGWMYKIDSNVNKVWSRIDTAFWSTQTGSANYLYDAVELPSGSIIACGYSRTYEPAPKDWGWLIKVSADGCVDTLSCAVLPTSSPAASTYDALRLFPNPTAAVLNIDDDQEAPWERIEVLNLAGQVLLQKRHTTENRLDLSTLEDGLYIVRLTRAGNTVARKVVKKGR